MTTSIGKVKQRRGGFDRLEDWLRHDRFIFVGWLTSTTFVTSWYTPSVTTSYLEGSSFLLLLIIC